MCGLTEEHFKTLWDSNPAEAFMAFIFGLSKMDEEGISAIKTLDDMGISEIRLRDTLLRSTNATDLFTRALSMADNARSENTTLTEEANKRYATTESQLINLTNKAALSGQTLGTDLKPTFEKIIVSVSDLDDIVEHWTDFFKTLTDKTRQSMVELKSDADASGLTDLSAPLAADIKRLDEIDAEVEALLKKRQNGFLTDKEKIRLEDLIDTRESIIVRYHLEEYAPDGFAEIGRKLEAEIARARATGKKDADVSVYESAVKAVAEGFAAATAEIDKQYDKEYALIQLMEDGTEKTRKQNELDARYNEERLKAAREYAALLSQTVMSVWKQTDIATQAYDIDRLCEVMTRYNIAANSKAVPGHFHRI